MALVCKFQWQNNDSTADLNDRLRVLVSKGIYFGGAVTPGVGLHVSVAPFLGVGYDGMTVSDSATNTLIVAPDLVQYVVVRARYNPLGVPVAPTLTWQVLSAAAYAVDPEKDYLITFAKVTLALGAVNVTLNDIDTSVRDEVTQVGRAWFRGVVPNAAALPVPPPAQNLIGDHYYVTVANTFYFWTGAIWSPMTTSGYNSETILHNRDLVDNEIQRLVNGSGVISGPRYTPGFTGSGLDVNINGTPLTADSINIDTFAVVVYGHSFVTKATTLAVPAKPVAPPDRYEIVFLEVWRESLAVPETYAYERNPNGATTYTLPQASYVVEHFDYVEGFGPGTDNFNFNPVGTNGHAGYVLKYRFDIVTADVSALYDPISGLAGWAPTNIDGQLFVASTVDRRVWVARPSATSIDNCTWAIPMFLLRRTSLENPVDPIPITEYREGVRYISSIYPTADVSKMARDAAETTAVSCPLSASLMAVGGPTVQPNDKPSGFITGMDYPVGPGVALDTIKFYDESTKFRIRGFEDWTRFNVSEFDLGSPAVGAGNYARTLVYIEMSITLYNWDDTDVVNAPGYYVSKIHRPLIPTYLLAGVVSDSSQGWRRGFVTYRVVTDSFLNTDYRDADDAMAAAGWSRGDNFLAGTEGQYWDGGLWSRTVTLTQDDRVHPFLTKWAIPVALVHRRNTTDWNSLTNPNGDGVGFRPDSRTNARIIHPDDLVDLRHTVDIDEGTLAKHLDADFDRNMKGQLRTRMANKWSGLGTGGEVAGSRILQSDEIGGAGGLFNLTLGDSVRTVWSDAKEFVPVCASFPLNANYADPTLLVSYTVATTTLTIRAPAGAHIVRWLPSAFVCAGSGSVNNYLQFNGPPLWSTRTYFERTAYPFPSPSSAKVLHDPGILLAYTVENPLETHAIAVADSYMRFNCTLDVPNPAVFDNLGRIVEMTYVFPTAGAVDGDIACLSWWVHYDRILNDADYGDNFGLAEIPDEVHAITKDPSGAAEYINNGPLYTVVRKSVLGASTTITGADVLAVAGTPGAVAILRGVAVENIRYAGTPPGEVATVTLDTGVPSITITWAAPFAVAQNVDIIVFYATDTVTQWMEIGRGGKSVLGPFTWDVKTISIVNKVVDDSLAYDLGASWWKHIEVAGELIEMPFVWQKPIAGVVWNLVRLHRDDEWSAGADPLSVGYPFSNVVSLSDFPDAAATGPVIMIIVPRTAPLGAAVGDHVRIDYTYTPYQGLSNSGGYVVDPLPAADLTRTKAMLHGTVLHNTDWIVTQAGACSKYGGVDSWTGWPVREPDRYLNYQYSAFADFNSPRLVRSRQYGTQDMFGRNYTNTNAAAVLRLPYPGDSHTAYNAARPHEFDLDPGREGASCGWFSYAPAYHSALTCDYVTPLNIDTYIRRDQFVNGLTPLSSNNFRTRFDTSHIVPPCDFQAVVDNTALYGTGDILHLPIWRFGNNDELCVDSSLQLNKYDALCATATALENWQVPATDGKGGDDLTRSHLLFLTPWVAFGTAGTHTLAHGYLTGYQVLSWPDAWTIGGGPNPKAVLLCHGCGTIDIYYKSIFADTQPILHLGIWNGPLAAMSRNFTATYAISEANRFHGYGLNIANAEAVGIRTAKPVDTLSLPWGSASKSVDRIQGSLIPRRSTYYADSSSTALAGLTVSYPASWDNATITAAETMLRASDAWNANYGRGIYLTSPDGNYRFTMPVLVPGSGTPVTEVFNRAGLPILTAEAPPSIPTAPAESPFAGSHRVYDMKDHGGALAYCGFGLHMLPSSDQYYGRVVMQISGGPLGQVLYPQIAEFGESTLRVLDETSVDGTALDAFWPTGRPVVRKR